MDHELVSNVEYMLYRLHSKHECRRTMVVKVVVSLAAPLPVTSWCR